MESPDLEWIKSLKTTELPTFLNYWITLAYSSMSFLVKEITNQEIFLFDIKATK